MSGYLTTPETQTKPITVPSLVSRKANQDKIVVVTAYDAPTASLAEAAGIDVILVGDSLGTVIQGHEDTLSVTLDEMIYHAKCVRRGCKRPLIVVDLPFGTFQQGTEAALSASIRVLKETGAAAVKIEGGSRVVETISTLTEQDIPVMGHLGLTPQSVHAFGGFRKQAKTESEAQRLIEDAIKLEQAGVFAVVLECIPAELAKRVQEEITIPTIGIGAGPDCDGQVLVFHDVLGLLPRVPSFVKQFANLGDDAIKGLKDYTEAVRGGAFPE